MVDGYSRLQTLYKVLLPLTKPALITAALWIFLTAWNDYIVAVTLTTTPQWRTLPVAVQEALGFYGRQWGSLTGSAMISLIPVVVLFLVFRDYFIGGLTSGAVKG
jgi:multiple sugar transport system permease protein